MDLDGLLNLSVYSIVSTESEDALSTIKSDSLLDPVDLKNRFAVVNEVDGVSGPAPEAAYVSTEKMPWSPAHHPGIYQKTLFSDPTAHTSAVLYKMDPGVSRPMHTHDDLEHLYIISGSFSDGHRLLQAGDYVLHRPDFPHLTACEEGCEMLLFFSPSNTPRSQV